jgi:hypothetical protein
MKKLFTKRFFRLSPGDQVAVVDAVGGGAKSSRSDDSGELADRIEKTPRRDSGEESFQQLPIVLSKNVGDESNPMPPVINRA